ncbi:hypothetical protein LINPERHAP2_LOCUS29211, partial [Linum perenne]
MDDVDVQVLWLMPMLQENETENERRINQWRRISSTMTKDKLINQRANSVSRL